MANMLLEVKVAALTDRLAKAEGAIDYLLQVVASLQAEVAQYRTIGAVQAPQYPAVVDMNAMNGQNHTTVHFSETIPVDNSASEPTNASNGAVQEDLWQFSDTMELDWDELGILDEESPTPSKKEMAAASLVPALSIPPTHKHARDETDDAELGDLDFPHEIKAMRYDSLDRILGYTVKASAVSDNKLIKVDANSNYDEERKATSGKIIRFMNVGDMNALSRLVSDYFCDSLIMHYCQIADTIHGKAEAMMLFSLLYESYPDGVWKITSTEVQGKVVTYQYLFTGTSVFDTPLAVSYHQVKEHQRGAKLSENSEEMAARQIARSVAEYNPRGSGDSGLVGSSTHGSIHNTNGSFNFLPTMTGAASGKKGELDLSHLSVYDRLHSPRSTDSDTNNPSGAAVDTGVDSDGTRSGHTPHHFTATTTSTSSASAADSDIIKIPRSKGNESFRLDGRGGSFTLGPERKLDLKHPTSTTAGVSKPPSISSEHLANALLRKTSEVERRKMEVTFNDYNLIVQIVISPAAAGAK